MVWISVNAGRAGARVRSSTDREVLVEIAEQQNRQIQPRVVHRQFGFLEGLFLLGVLEVGANHVAVRHFAAAFQGSA